MSTIARIPHPLYAVAWLAWYGFVIAALFRPHDPTFGLWVLLAFVPAEGSAVAWNSGRRDTLSEIATWVIRHLAKPESGFLRGWNAMLLMLVLLVATLLGRTVEHYAESMLLGWAIGLLTTVWLYDHWKAPEVHG